ncbi:hypothetical protein [Marinobacter salicampi]|nr:hypothetical protein [Marinobacter salicampi]
MVDILVNVTGVVLMGAIIGWFWLSGNRPGKTSQRSGKTRSESHH